MLDNRVELNIERLKLLNDVVRKTLSLAMDSLDVGVLTKPANVEQLEKFNSNVKNIITSKLRSKFQK